MEHPAVTSEQQALRLSESPASSPQVVQGPVSPVRSVYLKMESIQNQRDQGLRTADFFDDSSEDEGLMSNGSPRVDAAEEKLKEKRRSSSPQHRKEATYLGSTPAQYVSRCRDETRVPIGPQLQDFLRLTSTPTTEQDPIKQTASHSDSSYNGSAEDTAQPQARRINIHSPGHGRIVHDTSPHISAMYDEKRPITRDSKGDSILADQILGAHAITLSALLRDEEALDSSSQHPSRGLLAAATDLTQFRLRSASAPAAKKVSLVPPPIDTSGPQRRLPENVVRTPYPFHHRKTFSKHSPLFSGPSPSASNLRETVLALSIRRHGSTRGMRVARIVVPTNLDLAATSGPNSTTSSPRKQTQKPEKHAGASDFDDETLFRQLRAQHATLSGSWRFLSARVLKRIAVSHSSACSSTSGALPCRHAHHQHYACPCASAAHDTPTSAHGLAHAPRSPRLLASRGLSDTFSEQKLMQHFWRPEIGKARYAWVHWAHRVASSAAEAECASRVPDTVVRRDSPTAIGAAGAGAMGEGEGEFGAEYVVALDFVEGWSASRILAALGVIVGASLAAGLLWVFLGVGADDVGFRGAGSRVGTGMLMGAFVLLVGWTGVLGWMGVSWLVL